jgi:hypothetical protein
LALLDEPSMTRRVSLSEPDQAALAEASVDTPVDDADANVVPIAPGRPIFSSSLKEELAVPPPPAPPSPEEIRQFGESLDSPAAPQEAAPPPPPPPPPSAINSDGSAAADDEASLLMKYLQSEN